MAMKYLLMFIPCLLALWAPFYNRVDPQLFGLPFFYWFQLVLIPVSALGLYAADRARRS